MQPRVVTATLAGNCASYLTQDAKYNGLGPAPRTDLKYTQPAHLVNTLTLSCTHAQKAELASARAGASPKN